MDIESNTYEDLLFLKHPNGEKLPALKDYFDLGFKQNHTKLILEIKTSKAGAARTMKIAEIIATTLPRSEEHTSELQSRPHLVCRLLLEKKKTTKSHRH